MSSKITYAKDDIKNYCIKKCKKKNGKFAFMFIFNKSTEMFYFFWYFRALSADIDTRFK